jgi:hypothetical protein
VDTRIGESKFARRYASTRWTVSRRDLVAECWGTVVDALSIPNTVRLACIEENWLIWQGGLAKVTGNPPKLY